MRTLVEAATGLPTILFTSALVVVVSFWLLVALGVAEADSFDGDADLDVWGLGGIPVTVAFSLVTVGTWTLSIGATIMVVTFVPSGFAAGVLRLTVSVGAPAAAWLLIRLLIRPRHRSLPDEPGSSRPAQGIGSDLTGPAPVLRGEADGPLRRVPCTTPGKLPQTRDRAA
ncbi:hypothetical protein QQM39_03045 [Streptomyces sp. DT2A-34]|uniref:hypothetical protein n=1 Tax=Streptomyces sp. DT2A-34 TaxID=3051182 RepID=UPI00265C30E1|nr:hypothetical protein [Streptomyces sp. DT2A-34]MDO0909873.1 hypothetical protein [Streptomyces sp. DT2A-34]